jgi:hypothetical protein
VDDAEEEGRVEELPSVIMASWGAELACTTVAITGRTEDS